jgi:hypothetical protein
MSPTRIAYARVAYAHVVFAPTALVDAFLDVAPAQAEFFVAGELHAGVLHHAAQLDRRQAGRAAGQIAHLRVERDAARRHRRLPRAPSAPPSWSARGTARRGNRPPPGRRSARRTRPASPPRDRPFALALPFASQRSANSVFSPLPWWTRKPRAAAPSCRAEFLGAPVARGLRRGVLRVHQREALLRAAAQEVLHVDRLAGAQQGAVEHGGDDAAVLVAAARRQVEAPVLDAVCQSDRVKVKSSPLRALTK